MRGKVKNRKDVTPDSRYGSKNISKLINYIMDGGKKSLSQKIVYSAFDYIKEKTKEEPDVVFENALRNVGPLMEVRSRRVGGANYQVPYEVRPERRLSLALRWIIGAAQAKSGTPMYKRLAEELMAANNNEGEAMKKKENMHKMAESNKAFAHFAFSRKKKKK